MDHELIPEFVEESQRALSEIEADLLKLESGIGGDAECLNRIFRAIHSVKGTAGYLKLEHLVAVSHRAETLLDAIRHGEVQTNAATIDSILSGVDMLQAMLVTDDMGGSCDYADLLVRLDRALAGSADDSTEVAAATEKARPHTDTSETQAAKPIEPPRPTEPLKSAAPKPAPQPKPTEASKPKTPAKPSEARPVDAKSSTKTAAESKGQVSSKSHEADGHEKSSSQAAAASPTMRVPTSVLNHLLQTTGDMVMARNQLLSGSGEVDRAALERLSRLISEVHETVINTRKCNTGSLFSRFTRVVRDLGQSLGKDAALIIEGGDLELDRSIIEAFADPLTHLIRNCMDHAIEMPDERVASGKARRGEIKLRSSQQSGEVIIEIEDDGRGIDPVLIRRKATEKGLITREKAESLSDEDSLQLIFEPGFSTKDQATDLSGRGVGMDVVKTSVEHIGGVISIKSVVGKGTSFTAHLPLAKALVASSLTRILTVSIGDEAYAIPDSAVCEIIRPDSNNYPKDFQVLENGEVFHLRDAILPLVHLADALGKQRQRYSAEEDCYVPDPSATIGRPYDSALRDSGSTTNPPNFVLVIIRHRQHRFALVVNEVIGIEEAIVQPPPKLLQHCSTITGHAVLGDGHCMFLLDIGGITNKLKLRFEGVGKAEGPLVITAANQKQNERLLIFNFADDEYFAIPLGLASLVQSLDPSLIRRVGSNQFYPVRDRMVSLLYLDQHMSVRPMSDQDSAKCIIHPAKFDADVAICCGTDISVHELNDCFRKKSEMDQCVIGLFEWQERLVTLVDLYKLIELHLPDEVQPVVPENREARLLCVDDSFFFQKLLERYLSRAGWEVTLAANGREAWELLKKTDCQFDCIISDINMPEMNGFEFAEKVRGDRRFDHTPLIALTTQVDDQSRELGRSLGFDIYVEKINKFALQKCIDDVIKQHREASASC